MHSPAKLSDAEVLGCMAKIPAWEFTGDSITRTFVFEDFAAAFGFMATIALIAERMDHHPDWHNTYNRVAISLSTHDAGGITASDFALAQQIDRAAAAARNPLR